MLLKNLTHETKRALDGLVLSLSNIEEQSSKLPEQDRHLLISPADLPISELYDIMNMIQIGRTPVQAQRLYSRLVFKYYDLDRDLRVSARKYFVKYKIFFLHFSPFHMHIQYGLNKNLESNINFHGLEIPSEFTIAEARWNTPKITRTLSPPGAPVKSNKSKSPEKDLKARKLSFNDNVTVHEYDIETESSSSSLCSEDIDRDMENDVTNENEILCPESPEQPDSPLICLESIFEDRHSDSLFQSDSSESEPENDEVLRGRRAKKAFKVKFGSIPEIT